MLERKTDDRKRAVVYCRVTSVGAEGETALDEQVKVCLRYAELEAYEVGNVVIEIGYGAEGADIQQLTQVIQEIRGGKYEVFLAYSSDQFLTDEEMLRTFHGECLFSGTKVIFVDEAIRDKYLEKWKEMAKNEANLDVGYWIEEFGYSPFSMAASDDIRAGQLTLSVRGGWQLHRYFLEAIERLELMPFLNVRISDGEESFRVEDALGVSYVNPLAWGTSLECNWRMRLEEDALRFLRYYHSQGNPAPILKAFITLAETDGLENVKVSIDRWVTGRILKKEICSDAIPVECLRKGENYDKAIKRYCATES